jgi:hypothetical protein
MTSPSPARRSRTSYFASAHARMLLPEREAQPGHHSTVR